MLLMSFRVNEYPTCMYHVGVPRIVEGTCPLYEGVSSNQSGDAMHRVEQEEWKMLIDFLAKTRLNINVRQVV